MYVYIYSLLCQEADTKKAKKNKGKGARASKDNALKAKKD